MTDAGAYREIREAGDVTEAHIEEAADLREGLYGGERVPWNEVIDRIEASDEDWGTTMDSPAIKHLQRETNRVLRERRS